MGFEPRRDAVYATLKRTAKLELWEARPGQTVMSCTNHDPRPHPFTSSGSAPRATSMLRVRGA